MIAPGDRLRQDRHGACAAARDFVNAASEFFLYLGCSIQEAILWLVETPGTASTCHQQQVGPDELEKIHKQNGAAANRRDTLRRAPRKIFPSRRMGPVSNSPEFAGSSSTTSRWIPACRSTMQPICGWRSRYACRLPLLMKPSRLLQRSAASRCWLLKIFDTFLPTLALEHHATRQDPHSRFWLPGHPVDCTPRAGGPCLLRSPPL